MPLANSKKYGYSLKMLISYYGSQEQLTCKMAAVQVGDDTDS